MPQSNSPISKTRYLTIALLLAAVMSGCSEQATSSKKQTPALESKRPEQALGTKAHPQPNAIVLISIDTLRSDHTGLGGYNIPTTPFLTSLAKEGINFTRAYAPSSYTPTSMASLMTGLASSTHGVEEGYLDETRNLAIQDALPASLLTLAEALKSEGYRTIGVPSNRHLAADLGFSQGFDHYYEAAGFSRASALNRRVERMMKAAYGEQFATSWRQAPPLLWVHYFDPHDPYSKRKDWPPKGTVDVDTTYLDTLGGRSNKELNKLLKDPTSAQIKALTTLYDGDIASTDQHIKALWERYGFDDNTLLIVTSDHGEEFYEHGSLGHAKTLYEESVRVPLLIRWPAVLPQGRVVNSPVTILDIFPTLMDALQASIPPHLNGESLLPLIKGERAQRTKPLLLEMRRSKLSWVAQINGFEKHIRVTAPTHRVGAFDLKADPGERHNRLEGGESDGSPADRQALKALDDAVASLPPPPSDKATTTINDPEELEALKAMGYIE